MPIQTNPCSCWGGKRNHWTSRCAVDFGISRWFEVQKISSERDINRFSSICRTSERSWQILRHFWAQNLFFSRSVISLRSYTKGLGTEFRKTSTEFSAPNMLKLRGFKDFGDWWRSSVRTLLICTADSDFQNESKMKKSGFRRSYIHRSPKSLKPRNFIAFRTENSVDVFWYSRGKPSV